MIWIKQIFLYVIQALFIVFSFVACAANTKLDLESSICGIKEPIVFWLWSSAAGKPNPSRLEGVSNIVEYALKTKDGRILRGYKLKADVLGNTIGYLLVAQGNAMLADRIIDDFRVFSSAGFDVYVFDYRGYGRSEGKRRLKAILSDYREIINDLDTLGYETRAFYGMSFGGIVLLDALKADVLSKKVVIDSAPSKLSDYGCPSDHDPVVTLPDHAVNMLLIFGEQDRVVKPEDSKALAETAKDRGAEVLTNRDFGHPFMDGQINKRMKLILDFLKSRH